MDGSCCSPWGARNSTRDPQDPQVAASNRSSWGCAGARAPRPPPSASRRPAPRQRRRCTPAQANKQRYQLLLLIAILHIVEAVLFCQSVGHRLQVHIAVRGSGALFGAPRTAEWTSFSPESMDAAQQAATHCIATSAQAADPGSSAQLVAKTRPLPPKAAAHTVEASKQSSYFPPLGY